MNHLFWDSVLRVSSRGKLVEYSECCSRTGRGGSISRLSRPCSRLLRGAPGGLAACTPGYDPKLKDPRRPKRDDDQGTQDHGEQ